MQIIPAPVRPIVKNSSQGSNMAIIKRMVAPFQVLAPFPGAFSLFIGPRADNKVARFAAPVNVPAPSNPASINIECLLKARLVSRLDDLPR